MRLIILVEEWRDDIGSSEGRWNILGKGKKSNRGGNVVMKGDYRKTRCVSSMKSPAADWENCLQSSGPERAV